MDPHLLAQRCAEAMYASDKASQHLGIRIEDVAPGRATARMPVTGIMTNGHDICHGGYIVLLADTAFAFACNTYGRRTVAQGLEVSFIRAVHLGDELVAVATERTRWGRSGLYDVTVARQHGDVVAEFRGRSREIAGSVLDGQGGGDAQA